MKKQRHGLVWSHGDGATSSGGRCRGSPEDCTTLFPPASGASDGHGQARGLPLEWTGGQGTLDFAAEGQSGGGAVFCRFDWQSNRFEGAASSHTRSYDKW